jgi:hypothetical protein
MPRYVILLHQMPPGSPRATHWDLMLEDGPVLLTWAIASELEAGIVLPGQALADHRPAYLTYEGPVSGDRGQVSRWEEGQFQWLQREERAMRIQVAGQRFRGEIRLTRDTPLAADWQIVYIASTERRLP